MTTVMTKMTIDRIVVKEIEYPERLDWDLINKYSEGIPTFSFDDPKNPEWKETPIIPADLSKEGYGCVLIKDESDKNSNPTQTIKDGAAWELVVLYRDFAKMLYLQKKEGILNGNLGMQKIPKFSMISAGNFAKSVANMFMNFELPPPKILIDQNTPQERRIELEKLYADIYLANLGAREFTPEDVKHLTNNQGGVDITSVKLFEPQTVFYDWHVHESFNEYPDEIYVPYGSGRLYENYLNWQHKTAKNHFDGTVDRRLSNSPAKVASISILGAEPEENDSSADKLTKLCNPFVIFSDCDITAAHSLLSTGKNTGIYKVGEEYIMNAHKLLSKYCETEPSGAAGLALYMQRFDNGEIDLRKNILIVNTGKGI